MSKIFFESWESIFRTFIITILAYVALIIILRLTGKRTLTKMNAFDFVITIALGSAYSTVSLNKSVPLADGVLAIFLLVMLQYIITWLSVRYKTVKNLITNQPAMLLYKGEVFDEVLKKERITREELFVAARRKGISNLKDIDVIVLETTGDLTIIPNMSSENAETLRNIEHYKEHV